MGQKQGKALYADEVIPFLNLSRSAIEALWEAFNDVADGFGINAKEAREICAELLEELGVNRIKMDERSDALFVVIDTDANGLVDALELLSSLAAASGMSLGDTLAFVFGCYDFDGSGLLTLDEAALAMRGALTGLCKMAGERCPPESELEEIVIMAFEERAGGPAGRIKVSVLVEFCREHPEVRSWLDYFDDAHDDATAAAPEASARITGCLGSVSSERNGLGSTFPLPSIPSKSNRYSYLAAAPTPPRRLPKQGALMAAEVAASAAAAGAAWRSQPWVRAVESLGPTATAAARPNSSVPDAAVRLQWVHGYGGERARNNVRYAADGSVIYFAGRLGVSYEVATHRQSFNFDHADDVTCLAMHPEGEVVATGEVGTVPKIVVWNAVTTATIAILSGIHRGAVAHLAFSLGGRLLASVGDDVYHTLVVYVWRQGSVVFAAPTTAEPVFGLCFAEDDVAVTCGHNHIYFWQQEGRLRQRRRGVWGRKAPVQPLPVCCALRDWLAVGAATGLLLVWEGRNCIRAIRAHNGSLNALCETAVGLASGGKDMRVRLWTFKLEPGAVFDMSAFGPLPSVRSVCMSADGTKLLVGTKACEIYEVSAADGADINGGPITTAHYGSSLCGLAPHPNLPEFATAGDDGAVRVWDAARRVPLRTTRLAWAARCVDYSPDGAFLLVGMGGPAAAAGIGTPSSGNAGGGSASGSASCPGSGSAGGDSSQPGGGFVVLSAADLSRVFEARDSTMAMVEARWGPGREAVALGGEDAAVYVYSVGDTVELVAT
ncbi:unnamed protein product, partial [Phaeothamnion confervicola]